MCCTACSGALAAVPCCSQLPLPDLTCIVHSCSQIGGATCCDGWAMANEVGMMATNSKPSHTRVPRLHPLPHPFPLPIPPCMMPLLRHASPQPRTNCMMTSHHSHCLDDLPPLALSQVDSGATGNCATGQVYSHRPLSSLYLSQPPTPPAHHSPHHCTITHVHNTLRAHR